MSKMTWKLIIVIVSSVCFILVVVSSVFVVNTGGTIRKFDVKSPSALRVERQSTINESREYGYMIPDDTILNSADKTKLIQIYWRYINTLQHLCRNQTRIGSLKDGGKEICIDRRYALRKPCLVYSFGSYFQFDFEEGIFKHFGCEIHTFDPSQSPTGNVIPNNILTFHQIGLSEKDFVNEKKWVMRKLSTLVQELHHEGRVIDLIKIDIEGAEWNSFPEIFESGILQRVKQICIETHFQGEREELSKNLKILRTLYDVGFKIFMRDRNIYNIKDFGEPIGQITNINEISLVNEYFIQT